MALATALATANLDLLAIASNVHEDMSVLMACLNGKDSHILDAVRSVSASITCGRWYITEAYAIQRCQVIANALIDRNHIRRANAFIELRMHYQRHVDRLAAITNFSTVYYEACHLMNAISFDQFVIKTLLASDPWIAYIPFTRDTDIGFGNSIRLLD